MRKPPKDTKDETAKRLTEAEWIVVSSLWERGEVTLKDLSTKFRISEAALSQGLKRRNVKRGARAHEAFKETEEKLRAEREKLIEDIYNFKKDFLKYGNFLMRLTMNEITDAKAKGEKLIGRKNEIETIIAATKVYKTIRNDMYHLYNLYDKEEVAEEDKQEFNIGVYTQRELDELRQAQEIESSMDFNKFKLEDYYDETIDDVDEVEDAVDEEDEA